MYHIFLQYLPQSSIISTKTKLTLINGYLFLLKKLLIVVMIVFKQVHPILSTNISFNMVLLHNKIILTKIQLKTKKRENVEEIKHTRNIM